MRSLTLLLALLALLAPDTLHAAERPNVLFMIADDVSYPHASAYGSTLVTTPAFDRVAKQGVLFTGGFCPAPGCSPSRAAFLTGRHIWQIEEAGTHASSFPTEYEVYPARLEAAGYFVGHTGKGWGPGNFKISGRDRNPAGPTFNAGPQQKAKGYVGAFEKFLAERPEDQPFCFWFGSTDAHRGYEKGSGLEKGLKLEDATVPSFLPDTPEIRSDLLDYAFEVERFDADCDAMLKMLDAAGELDNTLVIVTADNGMPFPRAKANCYEYGIHMPLAISWPAKVPGGRTVDDLVGFVDLTATIYDATGVAPPTDPGISGTSILNVLTSPKEGQVDPSRTAVYAGRERHSSSRYNSLGYSQRAIRTPRYLYIRNFTPERWPAGAPRKLNADGSLGPMHGGYHDIDGCPALTFLIEHADDPKIGKYLDLAVALRPAEELFDVTTDPGCLVNLADDPAHAKTRAELAERLTNELRETNDARVTGNGDVWETYPRYSSLRWFPEPQWAKDHPDRVPEQKWVDEKRPK
jgi:N-sulfoglucosamine sulfohydrolase